MKLRKLFAGLLAALLLLSAAALADVTIGVPDDTTNEARALQLLADNGIIELAEGADETATKADVIADGIEIVEVQADQLVNQLPDLDYAVINSNFVLDALDAGFEPVALLMERRHIEGQAREIIARCGDIPLYTAERKMAPTLVGFTMSSSTATRRAPAQTCSAVSSGLRRMAQSTPRVSLKPVSWVSTSSPAV